MRISRVKAALILGIVPLLSGCGGAPLDYEYRLRFWERCYLTGQKLKHAGSYPEAAASMDEAVKQAKQLGPADFHIGVSLYQFGDCLVLDEQYDAAQPVLQDAIEALRQSLQQAKDDGDRKLLTEEISSATARLADTELALQHYDQAQQLFKQSIEQLKDLLDPAHEPGYYDNTLGQMVAMSLYKSAVSAQRAGNETDALADYKQALAVAGASAAQTRMTDRIHDDYRKLLVKAGDKAEIDRIDARANWIDLTLKGLQAEQDGPTSDVEKYYMKALDEAYKIKDTEYIVLIARRLCDFYDTLGITDNLERVCKDCLAHISPSEPRAEKTLRMLSDLYMRTGRFADAEPVLRRLLKLRQDRYGVDNPVTGQSYADLAYDLALQNKKEQAREFAASGDRVLQIRIKRMKDEAPAMAHLAYYYLAAGDPNRAALWARNADYFGNTAGRGRTAAAYLYLAEASALMGKPEPARMLQERTVSMLKDYMDKFPDVIDPTFSEAIIAAANVVNLEKQRGRVEDAKAFAQSFNELLNAAKSPMPRDQAARDYARRQFGAL
jgi:tetratricopeptide (TPR) repeat protein